MDNRRGVFLRSPLPAGIEFERICSPPMDAIDSSLGGSKDAIDDTRGSIPAEQRRSVFRKLEKMKIRFYLNSINFHTQSVWGVKFGTNFIELL